MKKNQLKNKNFKDGEAFATEASDMLGGMMAGASRSLVKTKAFWGFLGVWVACIGGGVWFLIWAVQTIAEKL